MDFFNNILTGVISNMIFTLILLLFGWFLFVFTKRKRLLKFFNIEKTKRLVVYLSTLNVRQGGSSGFDGSPRSFTGIAVVLNEQFAANEFKNLMNYILPSLSESSSLLSKILFSDVTVSVVPSPFEERLIDSATTVISFGSPGYNLVSRFIENKETSICKFGSNNSSLTVKDMPAMEDKRLGFVQKIFDKKTKCSFFYTAGIAELGTTGAAMFLAKEWFILSKKHGYDKSFLVILRFQAIDKWTIILEREIMDE